MIAAGCAAVLFIVAAIHVYWGLGGRIGFKAALPELPSGELAFTPPAALTLLVAMGLVIAALAILAVGRLLVLPLPMAVLRIGVAQLAFVFALRAVGEFRYIGFFKKIRGSRFARYDTLYYSPLCLALGLTLVWLLVSTRGALP